MSKVTNLAIDLLRTDGGTQMRAELTQEVYLDYRDKWLAGVEFDPVDVFYDGVTYWLADGFHRFYGAREAKRGSIPCRVHNGTQRDAILFACSANSEHGLRRTSADKRQAVTTLLKDTEWGKHTNAWIAEQAAVDDKTVASVRRELESGSEIPTLMTRTARDGKAYSVPTKPRKATKSKPNKPASVSGSRPPSNNASPQALPSEGTANQADQGSQGSGDAAGVCLHGGDHEWDKEACVKCHEPRPKISGGVTFDVDEIEAVAQADELDLASKQEPYDVILNHLTQAKKLWNQIVGDERDGVYAASKRQRVLSLLDDLYSPVAQCRPMKRCTFCEGKGCKKCSNCGWWPRSVVEGMSR